MNYKNAEEIEENFIKGVSAACGECGFKMVLVKNISHIEKICDKVIGEIKTARFVIADVTGQKQNVYFEAGYAFGRGIPVVWTCREGEEDKLQFDTRQYKHILWKTSGDLKDELIGTIKGAILK